VNVVISVVVSVEWKWMSVGRVVDEVCMCSSKCRVVDEESR
jgi:hypothetical protein